MSNSSDSPLRDVSDHLNISVPSLDSVPAGMQKKHVFITGGEQLLVLNTRKFIYCTIFSNLLLLIELFYLSFFLCSRTQSRVLLRLTMI